MEDAGAGGKRQRQVKFGRLSYDFWPDGETLNQAKRKSIPRSTKAAGQEKPKQNQPPVQQEYQDDGPHAAGSARGQLVF
jgi:hypothetical protein